MNSTTRKSDWLLRILTVFCLASIVLGAATVGIVLWVTRAFVDETRRQIIDMNDPVRLTFFERAVAEAEDFNLVFGSLVILATLSIGWGLWLISRQWR